MMFEKLHWQLYQSGVKSLKPEAWSVFTWINILSLIALYLNDYFINIVFESQFIELLKANNFSC